MSRRPGRTPIPLVDVRAQNAPLEEQFVQALREIIDHSDYGIGTAVERFEEQLAELVGVRHAIGVNSGTAALQLLLLALDVGPGDDVILPANTFFATAEAVVAAGARPVLVDPDLDTALASPAAVEDAVTSRTAAIVGVHLYGQPVDVDGYRAVAERCAIPFVEDAAQAIGAESGERRAGGFGTAAGFSFYPAKNLGALGQGGAVTTDDPEVARSVRMLRSHGEEERYIHGRMGFNERLHGLQAAFMSVKIPHVEDGLVRRERAVAEYDELLTGLAHCARVMVADGVRSAHHLYVIRVPDRDGVLADLRADGVGAAVHYPIPIHRQPAWDAGRDRPLPNAERLAAEVLSLPLFPGITSDQIAYCVESLERALERRAGDRMAS